jgi:ferrous-iron efflux pump FieF
MSKQDKGQEIAKSGLFAAFLISLLLFIVKIITYFFSGSMLVLASAFDSFADATISFVNSRVAKTARAKANRERPFGYGGLEVVGALSQGALMMFLAYNLIIKSYASFENSDSTATMDLEKLPIAAAILLISAGFGLIAQKVLEKKSGELSSQRERSLAVESDIAHYAGDVIVNILAAIGLVAAWYFKLGWLDSFLGIISGLWLAWVAFPLWKKSYADIVHMPASNELEKEIIDIVSTSSDQVMGIHHLRTRENGPTLFVDFHMVLPSRLALEDAHRIGDLVTENIKNRITRADIIIHLDPDSEEEHDKWRPRQS